MKKTDNVKAWYCKTFKTDELGKEINSNITFKQVLDGMKKGGDIYEIINVGDSIVRERIMGAIAELYYGGDYDYIYNLWLYGKDVKVMPPEEKENAYNEAMKNFRGNC